MTKLKLGPFPDEKTVKLTVELPAQIHRDLMACAEVLARETGQAIAPARLIAPMLARFMATDGLSPGPGPRSCRSLNQRRRPNEGADARSGIRRAAGSKNASAPDCRCGRANRQWSGPAARDVGWIAYDR
jgi:hypothetical protein